MTRVTLVPAVVLVSLSLLLSSVSADAATVELGTADEFAILAGAGITNTGTTTVTGDVGSHPTASQSGFGPGANQVILTGTNHHDDAVTVTAKAALVTAYDDAAGRPSAAQIVGGELGGLTLTAGVYEDDDSPDSLAITGTLTLDGENDPDSVFIFQSDSTLITASGSNVILINGAQACNIFWQVGSSTTLGSGSHIEGTILALTSITMNSAATLDGRALARNGAVTLDNNTIQLSPCSGLPIPTPTSTPTPTPTSTPTITPTQTPPPTVTTPTPSTIPIPFFPTTAAFVLGAAGAAAAAIIVIRRRRA